VSSDAFIFMAELAEAADLASSSSWFFVLCDLSHDQRNSAVGRVEPSVQLTKVLVRKSTDRG